MPRPRTSTATPTTSAATRTTTQRAILRTCVHDAWSEDQALHVNLLSRQPDFLRLHRTARRVIHDEDDSLLGGNLRFFGFDGLLPALDLRVLVNRVPGGRFARLLGACFHLNARPFD